MIRLRDLHKSYRTGNGRRQVLRGLDLDVAPGELVALLGRSGSGKTTLLNIVGGLDTGYQGTVQVAGRQLQQLSDAALSGFRSTSVGFVFQSYFLLEHLPCLDNVMLPAVFARGTAVLSERAARERALALLREVGIQELAGQHPGRLSGGEQQRVAIARALFHQPQLLLCDEVTGNLDAETGERIVSLLGELNRKHGVTLLMATHDELISQEAHRILHLQEGTISAAEES